jgi:hypothetical protein
MAENFQNGVRMRTSTLQRTLTLTVASGLAIALVAACSDGSPTAPQKFRAELPSTIQIVNDNDLALGCLYGGVLKAANGKTADRDLNGDGWVCVSTTKGKKH